MNVNATIVPLKGSNNTAGDCQVDANSFQDVAALSLVVVLCESLRRENIDYCHWKSNAALDRSATGDNDLDLLVGRAASGGFARILHELGFKEAQVSPEERLPGVRDFYGYDEKSGRFVHVHAHFQLTLGHDFSKNYHLPIERAYLDSAVQGDLFRVPAPEFEFVVFVIRMILKHCTWDVLLLQHGRLSDSERHELEYLRSRVNLETAFVVLKENLPAIDNALFGACVQCLQPAVSLAMRILTGERLRHTLRACARRSPTVDTVLKLWRRIERPILFRLHLRTFRKRMLSGGMMIAIIGGDGSGKTTAVTELRQRLSAEFDVLQVHMGKPRWSWTTILIRGVIKLGRSLGLYPFLKEGTELSLDTNSPEFPGYPWLIREVCTARDRYLEYQRARRFASNGGLVICDRFPIPHIRIMDGAQVERVTVGLKSNHFLGFLAALERYYYRQIHLPDLLIVLRVDPEICVQRKTNESPQSVRSRSEEIWHLDWSETPAHVVDANQPKSQVTSDVLSLVWSHV